MSARGILFAGICAITAIASASPASAYTYQFVNGTQQPIRQLWMHTVSKFCHDVNWRGNVAPGGQVSVNSASVCLVDRIEVNGGGLRWSAATGQFGGTFAVARDGICFLKTDQAAIGGFASLLPFGPGAIVSLGFSLADLHNSGSCR